MSEPTVKHFIIMRFFPNQDIGYLYNVLHKGFLKKQLDLAVNNSLRSLENQTNKNFEVVFLMHPRFFVDKSYEFLFTTLRDAITVPVHFPKKDEYPPLVKDASNKYDFVILSRMDFDDFLHKDAVADTQNKVNECENVLVYGYCNGYAYLNEIKEVFLYFRPFNGIGHNGLLQSCIWKTSFAKSQNLLCISPYFSAHTKIKLKLKEFLEKNGIQFSESMFQQNTTMKAYIYFRHEFSHWLLTHNRNPDRSAITAPDSDRVTSADITKKELEEDYGFTYELNSIE